MPAPCALEGEEKISTSPWGGTWRECIPAQPWEGNILDTAPPSLPEGAEAGRQCLVATQGNMPPDSLLSASPSPLPQDHQPPPAQMQELLL